jgi:hypothetical protein
VIEITSLHSVLKAIIEKGGPIQTYLDADIELTEAEDLMNENDPGLFIEAEAATEPATEEATEAATEEAIEAATDIDIPSNQLASSYPQCSQSVSGLRSLLRGMPCSQPNISPSEIEPRYHVLSPPVQAPVSASTLPVQAPVSASTLPVQAPVSASTLPVQAPVSASTLPVQAPIPLNTIQTIPVPETPIQTISTTPRTSTQPQQPPKRGRPPGSKNKSKDSDGTQPTHSKRRK